MDKAVKIDARLLRKVEDFIKEQQHTYTYTNKKHFIDKAVNELLQKEQKKRKKHG